MGESVFGFQARAEQSFRQQLDSKDKELDRAKLALRLAAAKLEEQRHRGLDALAELVRIRDGYRGQGASRAAYVAILAVYRAKKALGLTPGEPVYSAPTFKDSADRRFRQCQFSHHFHPTPRAG